MGNAGDAYELSPGWSVPRRTFGKLALASGTMAGLSAKFGAAVLAKPTKPAKVRGVVLDGYPVLFGDPLDKVMIPDPELLDRLARR